ncbi:MAG: flagellar biosynthesis protein FlhF [Peptostreptococcaceae bacterium]|nr:flagellar biosynthesis protein FlhF [Peptostreptococcaceae bacterium]
MIVKKYLVDDMYDAMVKIKQDLGSNAIIVSKRSVRQKGFFWFLKKRVLEVTAATETEEMKERGIQKKTPVVEKEPEPEKDSENMCKEVHELRDIVMELVGKVQTPKTKAFGGKNALYDMLVDMDFNRIVIDDFDTYCEVKKVSPEDVNRIILYEFLKERFNDKLKVDVPKSRVMIFVGPTGVGKTTTIAKIASSESLIHQKKVGLITIDTYRIGAVEQLKIYANILDIPLEVVVSKEELQEAFERLDDCDLILIDSTGRSHKNTQQLDKMKSYIDVVDDKKTYLVVSMTTKNTDFVKIIKNYECMDYDHLILTKLDETQSYGNIVNAFYCSDKPITYISTGQVVPDDLEKASKDLLFKYAWGELQV